MFFKKSSNIVKDVDGNEYNTVKIGDLIWTTEDLRTTRYNDKTSMQNITDHEKWIYIESGAYCTHEDLKNNENNYRGLLYNWYAIGSQKLAPKGWHVPTKKEWEILIASENVPNDFFTPYGGFRNFTKFWEMNNGFWWAAEEDDKKYGYVYHSTENGLQRLTAPDKRCGASIRLVKN